MKLLKHFMTQMSETLRNKYALENITITPLVNELDQCGNMLN